VIPGVVVEMGGSGCRPRLFGNPRFGVAGEGGPASSRVRERGKSHAILRYSKKDFFQITAHDTRAVTLTHLPTYPSTCTPANDAAHRPQLIKQPPSGSTQHSVISNTQTQPQPHTKSTNPKSPEATTPQLTTTSRNNIVQRSHHPTFSFSSLLHSCLCRHPRYVLHCLHPRHATPYSFGVRVCDVSDYCTECKPI